MSAGGRHRRTSLADSRSAALPRNDDSGMSGGKACDCKTNTPWRVSSNFGSMPTLWFVLKLSICFE